MEEVDEEDTFQMIFDKVSHKTEESVRVCRGRELQEVCVKKGRLVELINDVKPDFPVLACANGAEMIIFKLADSDPPPEETHVDSSCPSSPYDTTPPYDATPPYDTAPPAYATSPPSQNGGGRTTHPPPYDETPHYHDEPMAWDGGKGSRAGWGGSSWEQQQQQPVCHDMMGQYAPPPDAYGGPPPWNPNGPSRGYPVGSPPMDEGSFAYSEYSSESFGPGWYPDRGGYVHNGHAGEYSSLPNAGNGSGKRGGRGKGGKGYREPYNNGAPSPALFTNAPPTGPPYDCEYVDEWAPGNGTPTENGGTPLSTEGTAATGHSACSHSHSHDARSSMGRAKTDADAAQPPTEPPPPVVRKAMTPPPAKVAKSLSVTDSDCSIPPARPLISKAARKAERKASVRTAEAANGGSEKKGKKADTNGNGVAVCKEANGANGKETNGKANGKTTPPAQGESKDNPRYKTVLCTRWEADGKCRYADQCYFAHGKDELRKAAAGADARAQPTEHNFKTKLCNNFASEGTCPRGDACSFAHGETELRKLERGERHGKENGHANGKEVNGNVAAGANGEQRCEPRKQHGGAPAYNCTLSDFIASKEKEKDAAARKKDKRAA
eukprot:TRINITY_DN3797_c1_g1_i1.p1 TRINITY_DN3797_c1_g1~~TRINITY_DN3797_c1_g1_i1.p1  ORF type:complete len:657 (+),score=246.15 TRINITY_DN3797_c1_g1_i1:150-1973(+)